MRIQSSHDFGARGFDAYWTCNEAIRSLIALEDGRIPRQIWEPAAGTGAIVTPLCEEGYAVTASDIFDYGLPGCLIADYLTAAVPPDVEGVITNPPFRLAEAFLRKALFEVNYVALLVRTNFVMEGVRRKTLLTFHPPTRLWLSARRLPMMHRHNWNGRRSSSNTPHAWAVWQRRARREFPRLFDWKEVLQGDNPHQWRAAQCG
jgi:hypothetical protein